MVSLPPFQTFEALLFHNSHLPTQMITAEAGAYHCTLWQHEL
jgi:hypothetical protein